MDGPTPIAGVGRMLTGPSLRAEVDGDMRMQSFFQRRLEQEDPEIAGAIGHELGRQRQQIELIA
ncbi:MAG: hypothetical protein ACREFU_00825, partial [Acetobacteraceae bacterium]